MRDSNKIWKFFGIGEAEKEEQWLNEMADKGKLIKKVKTGRYTFEDGTPGKYIYKLELLEHDVTDSKSVKYLEFLEEMGIEYVTTFNSWIYLRKNKDGREFELYSDLDSRIKYYDRIVTLSTSISVACFMLFGIGGFFIFNSSISVYIKIFFGLLYGFELPFILAKVIIPVCKEKSRLDKIKEIEQ